MKIRNTLVGLLALLVSTSVMAGRKEVVLNPQHPERYVVAADDTLWGVASRFLRDPWQWPELWESDRKATRPLRPGDVLTLSQVNGKPRLQLNASGAEPAASSRRAGDPLPVVKLSPKVRVSPMEAAIPVIPMSHVRSYLSYPKVVSEDELDRAPYLVDFPDYHRFVGTGERVYVRGLSGDPLQTYGLFHKSVLYQDGETGEKLGYEAVHVGEVALVEEGDPATFILTRALREGQAGDRLLELEEERLPTYYEPHAPDSELKGHIIGVMGAQRVGARHSVTHVGQYSVVVVDRGTNEGLERGHVLDIYHRGRTVRDKVKTSAYDTVVLPEEIVGSLLIFRPFERVSFGLVMDARRELNAGDVVRAPY